MKEKCEIKPKIEQIGGQMVCSARPLRDNVGWGKEFQIYAKLNSQTLRIVWDWRMRK